MFAGQLAGFSRRRSKPGHPADGELTDDTRLVVRGDTDAPPVFLDDRTKQHLEAAAEIVSEAHRRGIPVISEQEFLARTGGPPLPLSDEDLEVLREQQIQELMRKLKERDEAPNLE